MNNRGEVNEVLIEVPVGEQQKGSEFELYTYSTECAFVFVGWTSVRHPENNTSSSIRAHAGFEHLAFTDLRVQLSRVENAPERLI